ncbi:MAG: glycosyltransferase family 4 protein [Candidatus Edwardsbacteria bacterium]
MSHRILCLDHVSKIGGAQKSLLLLLKNINHQKYLPLTLCPGNGPLISELEMRGVSCERLEFEKIKRTVNPLSILSGTWKFLATVLKITVLLKEKGIKLVYANSLKTAIIGGIAARLTKRSSIWHVRDFIPSGLFRPLFLFAGYLLMNRIIVNSKAVAGIFGKKASKVRVVYNAQEFLKIKEDKDEIRRDLGLDSEDLVLGWAGRIHPEKGLEYLIEAMREILDFAPKVKLLILGDASLGNESYERRLKKLSVHLKVQDRIQFLGFHRDISQIFSTFDIFVLPSLREPFGLVTLEAMQLGKPVIATNTGGTPEIVVDGETGLLVPPKEAKALAQAIISLLKNREFREKMGRQGKERVQRNFSLESHLRGMEEVFDEVIK